MVSLFCEFWLLSFVSHPMEKWLVAGMTPGSWESDFPKIGRGWIEFDGDVKAFRHFTRGTRDSAGDALSCLAVLENQAGVERKAALHKNQGAMPVDAQRGDLECGGLAVQCDVNVGADAKHDALSTAMGTR